MRIQLRFFARIREAVGVSQETVDLPPEIKTMGDVRAYLQSRGDVWADALGEEKNVRMALNHVMTTADTALSAEGEVAFFPPVTGG